MIGETSENAVHVRLEASDVNVGKLLLVTAFTLAPVVIAIVMQHPALRQKIAMRLYHTGEVTTGKIAKQFADVSAKCHLRYDLARM